MTAAQWDWIRKRLRTWDGGSAAAAASLRGWFLHVEAVVEAVQTGECKRRARQHVHATVRGEWLGSSSYRSSSSLGDCTHHEP